MNAKECIQLMKSISDLVASDEGLGSVIVSADLFHEAAIGSIASVEMNNPGFFESVRKEEFLFSDIPLLDRCVKNLNALMPDYCKEAKRIKTKCSSVVNFMKSVDSFQRLRLIEIDEDESVSIEAICPFFLVKFLSKETPFKKMVKLKNGEYLYTADFSIYHIHKLNQLMFGDIDGYFLEEIFRISDLINERGE